jgi:putative membrane protein
MIHTNENFSKRVERAVVDVEKHTDAEVVVVAAERSGSYRDVAMMVGAVASMLVLLAAMAVPTAIHPAAVIVNMVIANLLITWIFQGRVFLHFLVPKERQHAHVQTAAAAEFTTESVHATPNRTGLLVYVSALEGRVEIIPDVGLQERIPQGEWALATSEFTHDDLDHFLAGLQRIGAVLAQRVPKLENDEVDLPNAPRIR